MIRTDLCGGRYLATPYDDECPATARDLRIEAVDDARRDAHDKAAELLDLLSRHDGTSGEDAIPFLATATDLAGLIRRVEAAIKAGGTP
jgi:hypothetical protein